MIAAKAPQIESLAVTIPQAGQLMSLGQSTVRRLIAKGDLRIVKAGKSVRIARKEIDRFLSGGPASAS